MTYKQKYRELRISTIEICIFILIGVVVQIIVSLECSASCKQGFQDGQANYINRTGFANLPCWDIQVDNYYSNVSIAYPVIWMDKGNGEVGYAGFTNDRDYKVIINKLERCVRK